jgi:cytochrome P450
MVAHDLATDARKQSGTAKAPGTFDPGALEPSGSGWFWELVLSYPRRLICIARLLFPVVRGPFTPWYFVLRYDEVREVLSHDKDFPVAWDGRMKDLTRGKNFVLGMARGPEYRRSYGQIAQAYPLEDIPEHVEQAARDESQAIVDAVAAKSPPTFDAVEELIIEVPARLCRSYYGIESPAGAPFGKWTLAISAFVFGPTTDAAAEANARAAAAELSAAIRHSIRKAQSGLPTGKAMERLVALQKQDPAIDDDTIHAHLFGMVLGFIPTNVLSGGNILETLLRRPDYLKPARTAALADDDELLWRCLREALRFRHINLGPWRSCPKGYTLGAGGPWPVRIPPGSLVLASMQSAMFDPRRIERPNVFDPYRRDEDYMVFGVGQHWCVGAYIAKAQLTQTFKVLLKREGLAAIDNPSVRTKRFNDLFPLHLVVGFDK